MDLILTKGKQTKDMRSIDVFDWDGEGNHYATVQKHNDLPEATVRFHKPKGKGTFNLMIEEIQQILRVANDFDVYHNYAD